jgi:hypothetical protein
MQHSSQELALCQMLGVRPSTLPRWKRIQQLGAFWQHFAIHRRTCDRSGRKLVSVFREDCPYPVWDRDLWTAEAQPPVAQFDFTQPFFTQLWALFQRCPIPHMVGVGSENCEYCDDWWHSRNCYLCHSGLRCEDCLYCYRCFECRDCRGAVFSFNCELCSDVLQSHRCFALHFGHHSWQCRDSAFLFDCRNCDQCFMCWNQRNKRYCIRNQQYSKQEYLRLRAAYDLSSYATYEALKVEFLETLQQQAYWKALEQERCTDSSGCYIENLNRCEDCYFISESESLVNCVRGIHLRDSMDAVGALGELIVNSVAIGIERAYQVSHSYHCTDCSRVEYCGFCSRCDNCFACCGLVGKSFCILNQQYSEAEYQKRLLEIKQHLSSTGVLGQFFPGYFSPCPYGESFANVHFPLSNAEAEQQGFRVSSQEETAATNSAALCEIPDSSAVVDPNITSNIFYDEIARKRFTITKTDIAFAQKLAAPLPRRHYSLPLKEMYSNLHYDGALRAEICAFSKQQIFTNLPATLSGRIVANDEYERWIAG